MSWPAVAAERGSLPWFRREVSLRMGYDPDPNVLTHQQRGMVDSVIESGLNKFYYPPPGEYNLANATEAQRERLRRAPHAWTFMQRTFTLNTVINQTEYDLPVDFAAFIGQPTTNRQGSLAIVNESHLRQLIDSTLDTGLPQYAAVHYSAGDGSSRARARLVVYPRPSAVEPLKIKHAIAPPMLTDARPWPVAGVEHTEAILACCLAVADERTGKDTSLALQTMMQQLATSIMVDIQTGQASSDGIWPEDAADDNYGLAYITKQISIKLGLGPNINILSQAQKQKIKEVYRSALRRIVNPPLVPGEKFPHQWTWLKPVSELETVANQSTYALPANFATFEGPLTYKNENYLYREIKVTSELTLRKHIEASTGTGTPEYAAVRFKETDQDGVQRYELLLWPVPGAAYTLQYRYRINQTAFAT